MPTAPPAPCWVVTLNGARDEALIKRMCQNPVADRIILDRAEIEPTHDNMITILMYNLGDEAAAAQARELVEQLPIEMNPMPYCVGRPIGRPEIRP